MGKRAENNTAAFLREVTEILIDYVKETNDRNNKILDFHYPDEIFEAVDFGLPERPQNIDQLLEDCKEALKYQVKTGN